MLRKSSLIAVLTASLALSACATQPQQFSQSANNVVENVGTGANAAVGIVTSLAKALLAIGQPISDILSFASGAASRL